MKKYNIIFLICILSVGLLVESCEGYFNIDEEPPSGKISGVLTDDKGNPFYTDNNRETTTVSLLMETDSIPLTFRVKPDGTYSLSKLIGGSYTMEFNGPFFPLTEQTVNINGDTKLDVVVAPFLEYTISQVEVTDTSITISYEITGNNTAQPNDKAYVWSTHPYPSIAEYSGGGIDDITTNVQLVGGVQSGSYTITDLESKTSYYIRMCGSAAETEIVPNDGYYNYSNQLIITTQ